MRTLKLIVRFYRGIFLANFLVTLSCLGLIGYYSAKAHEIIALLFWFKLMTVALVISAAIYYKKQELYYYQNLGVSKVKLGLVSAAFDFTLWGGLIFITAKLI